MKNIFLFSGILALYRFVGKNNKNKLATDLRGYSQINELPRGKSFHFQWLSVLISGCFNR